MPIYEYYCPENHTIYQFYAKTLAQGKLVPRCPDNPKFRMQKAVSAFAAITGGGKKDDAASADIPEGGSAEDHDPRIDAAMQAMESEMSQTDENDPKAMARMMRRMSELTGEKIEGEMEEVVRKLEGGADPDGLESMLAGEDAAADGSAGEDASVAPTGAEEKREARHRFRARHAAPRRDPKLYDYE